MRSGGEGRECWEVSPKLTLLALSAVRAIPEPHALRRVVFEATHMANADFDALAVLFHSHGFVHLVGGHRTALNIWQNARSREGLRPGIPA
jgi:hypothetical protein